MKTHFIILWGLLTLQYSISQSNYKEWVNDLDSINFEVFYKKRKISKPFLKAKKWTRKNIANLNGNFRAGCTGRGKRIRLNWVSKDNNGIEFYSFSFGGRGFHTKYFLFYKGKIEELDIKSKKRYINFQQLIQNINDQNFSIKK